MKNPHGSLILSLRALLVGLAVVGLGEGGAAAQDAGKGNAVSLFNGKDLTGFTDLFDNGSEWQVRNGILEGRGGGRGNPAVLLSEKQNYKNYKLRVTFGYLKQGGGGIELRRSGRAETTSCYWVSACPSGYSAAAERPAGNLTKLRNYRYGSAFPPARESEPIQADVGNWHTLEVTVTGNRITTVVNGAKADEYVDNKQGFRAGGIALFCCGDSTIQFREIVIEELAE